MSFVHLHVHSQYSLLDGFSNLKAMAAAAREMGMPAIALTDHGTMFGVIEFYTTAIEAGIKPIIGLEAYLAARRMSDREAKLDKSSFHMLLLAENETGYKNLLKIASAAQLEGFYYYPRIDHAYLADHSEGLIATSGCLAAEIPQAIMGNDLTTARQKLDWYYSVFGPDRFFLELQEHPIPELKAVNRTLLDLGKHYNARYVATNDAHYIKRSDARLQDIMLAIQTASLLSDPKRMKMGDDSYYLRPPAEMAQLFSEVPEAVTNTLLIAERINLKLDFKEYHLPLFEVPEGTTPQTYLRRLCEEGLQRRYGTRAAAPEVRQRLEYELDVIHNMGFNAYFLIVGDLCRYARQNGIWYNARGSAGGSIVAYVLDITLVEPLGQDLFFERFLNPGRISMPDVDLDFQDDRRADVMQYCAEKYGNDRVSQIITFGTLGARAAVRDVGRVMDIPLSEVDRVSKLIPTAQGRTVTIKETLEQVPEFKAVYDEAEYLKELIDTASQMEGVVRNAGTHAAGVIITDQPILTYAPLHRPTSGAEDSPIKTVCQFEMNIIEKLKLLKVDFLGLATLTIMARACKLIQERHGIEYHLGNIPLDDDDTFLFLGQGHTAGVFQLEGTGMTRYLVQMKPRNLSNVIAMVALYRPGPLEFIPSYIRRMHKEEPVTYRHASLEPIFNETYGIPIYQEQIMKAAVDLAGYSLSEADELRKAISKKQKESLLKHQTKFVAGAVGRGIPEQTAQAIFADWEEFARYGFNKAHAADYGVIAVQTAYLKTHYTAEYMTAVLSASKNDTDKVALYVADCRSMGIEVLPPDVNASQWDFAIEDRPGQKPAIRFGLGAVKNVGQAPVELILAERKTSSFSSLNDFLRRLDLRQVGKRALECLIKVGALDSYGPRPAMLDSLDRIIAVSTSHFRATQIGQMSFFGEVVGLEETVELCCNSELSQREQLEWERELIGLYVSDHPLTPYLPLLRNKVSHFSGQLGEAAHGEKVTVAGMVNRFRIHTTKDGKTMAFATLEDIQGNIEMVIFPRTWKEHRQKIEIGAVISVEGKIDAANGDPKVLVDKITAESLADLPPQTAGTPQAEQPPKLFELEGEWPPSALEEPADAKEVRMPIQTKPADNEPAFPDLPPEPPDFDDSVPPEPEMPGWELTGPQPGPAQLPAKPASPPPEKPAAPAAPVSQGMIKQAVPLPVAAVMPILPAPLISPLVDWPNSTSQSDNQIRMVTLILRPCGDLERDRRKIKRAHGELTACPGRDHFSLLIYEGGRGYQVEFPNETTGITPLLLQRLKDLVGEENIRVEVIKIQ